MSTVRYKAGEIWEAIEDDIAQLEKDGYEPKDLADVFINGATAEDWLLGMKLFGEMESDRTIDLDLKTARIVEEARKTGVIVTKGRPFSINYNPLHFDRDVFPDPVAIYDRRGRLIREFETCQELANYLAKQWPDLDPQTLLVQG